MFSICVNGCIREIESYPERFPKFKIFINKYNWKRISYPLKIL